MSDSEQITKDDNFLFSWTKIADIEKDLDLQENAIKDAIDRISDGCKIPADDGQTYNWIQWITKALTNEEDLIKLSKGLALVAPLISKYKMVKEKQAIVKAATSQRNWLIASFADFDDELSQFLVQEKFNGGK